MGLLSIITRKRSGISSEKGRELANDGSHNLDANKVLAQTDKGVITPNNADFSSIRTAPVVPKPRYFTIAEAGALKTLAREKRVMADASKSAYSALKSLEESDTEVHTTHRSYQSKVARNELEKKQSDAKLAKNLHGLRPGYAELHRELKVAETNATAAINAIKQSYGC